MLKRTQKKKKKEKNYKNRNEICEKIFLVLKRHRCIHSFRPKIPCLRQHKQAVTLHLADRALGFPSLLEPSERGSCRKHHLLESKRDREGDRRRRDKVLGRVRHSRAAPGLGTRAPRPPSPPLGPSRPQLDVPGTWPHSPSFQPAGERWDGGQRETGVVPPLPLPHPAQQPGHCSHGPAPWPAQWRGPRLPLRPTVSTMAGLQRAGVARHSGPLTASPHLPCHSLRGTQQTGAQPADVFREAAGGKLRQGVGPPDTGAAQDTWDLTPLLPGHDEKPCPQQSSPRCHWGPLGILHWKGHEPRQVQCQSAQQRVGPL